MAIQSEQLNDLVEVNVFARATKDISLYRVDKAHSDYGDVAFQVEKGDILAIAEGQVFPLDCNYDSLRRIGSIMSIQESMKEGDHPMLANFENDKIQIILAKKDFQEYKFLKALDTVSSWVRNIFATFWRGSNRLRMALVHQQSRKASAQGRDR